jgi:hypothetical protein
MAFLLLHVAFQPFDLACMANDPNGASVWLIEAKRCPNKSWANIPTIAAVYLHNNVSIIPIAFSSAHIAGA